MIIVNALLQQKKLGDMEVMTCNPYWDASKGLKATMSDKELGLENTLDDGTTWAEGWIRHPNWNTSVSAMPPMRLSPTRAIQSRISFV